MVKAAEMTGELPETLDDMSNYFSQMEKTRKQMVTAMMYPSIIMIFAFAVITFILLWYKTHMDNLSSKFGSRHYHNNVQHS